MSLPLVTSAQLASVQNFAKRMFKTAVKIERRNVGASSMGDDDTMASAMTVVVSSVNAWVHSTPTTRVSLDTGQIITVNDYRLNVPIGTDIQTRDIVTVIATGTRYRVVDTTNDETWPAMLNCSLLLRE